MNLWDNIIHIYHVHTHAVKRVIFNDPATIVYWDDGTKTVVKCSDGDDFSPEKGFLHAYFEKHSGLTKTKAGKFFKMLDKLAEESKSKSK